MCCPTCTRHDECRTRIEIHAHKMAQTSMPNPHYHLCRAIAKACDFDCRRCGRLSREMPRLMSAHFAYGCCHRCSQYQGCDFVERHRNVISGSIAAAGAERVQTEPKENQPMMPVAASIRESVGSPPPA